MWHILGAGAMGCLFAEKLKAAGKPAALLMRAGYTADTAQISVEREEATAQIELPASACTEDHYVSHLLITTKAQDVVSAAETIAHRLDSASQVVIMSNGLGFAEDVAKTLPGVESFYGTTTEGAYRLGERHIRHAGTGITRIGRAQGETAPPWFVDWEQAITPSIWDPAIQKSLWLKLAINCAINPLTALHNCQNGELALAPLAALVDELCDEVMLVSAAAGFADVTRDLRQQVEKVITATAANRSSMLQDVLAGRGTEIDYITGYLLHVGKAHGITLKRHTELYHQIKNGGS